ncbi:MAG: gamma-glutamylcyclotransferase [Candidatus Competibacterales bacterium]
MAEATTRRIFICGSALRGQPDHGNLQGARLLQPIATAPKYRLHAVGDGWHPGIYQTIADGISIPGELYELREDQYQHLAATEPPNMYPAEVELADGTTATAFLYPKALIDQHGWPDISHHGGWANYKRASQGEG